MASDAVVPRTARIMIHVAVALEPVRSLHALKRPVRRGWPQPEHTAHLHAREPARRVVEEQLGYGQHVVRQLQAARAEVAVAVAVLARHAIAVVIRPIAGPELQRLVAHLPTV